jgi:hypothetical protein
MFSDREVAARAMEAMKRIIGDLDQMLIVLKPIAPPDEYRACRLAVGHLMAEVFERLAEPIASDHSDLRYWA